MNRASLQILAVAVVTAAGLLSAPATASAAVPSRLSLRAPDRGHIFTTVPVTATLTDPAGQPLQDRQVRLQRWVDGGWSAGRRVTTNANGVARAEMRVRAHDRNNRFRATWAGDPDPDDYAGATSDPEPVNGVRVDTRLRLFGPDSVVDERRTTLRIRWVARDGRNVHQRVRLLRRNAGQRRWRQVRSPLVDHGRTRVRVRPRVDTRWKVVGAANVWHTRARSRVHRVDNRPPSRPVVLPRKAPRPDIKLKPQQRASGGGLNAKVTRIPGKVWRHMTGRSWHRGCPVGRPSLRLVRMNYWGFDGYRHRGEMVVHRRVARPTVGAFRDLYQMKTPIRSMYRVDRFGWSRRLHGANDYKSMAADNTSAFNCRNVVGRPGVRSPHSYGDAIDLDPWENPYVSRQGTYPNRWWLHRSHKRVAWRSRSHPVVRAFRRHGFAWGGSYSDFHHFED